MTGFIVDGVNNTPLRLRTRTAMMALGMLGAIYAVNAMDRVVFSILLPNVRKEFGFSLVEAGILSTIFTIGIGFSGIATGYLMDRISRMNVILIGSAIYSVLTILSAVSTNFYDMALYRALSGVGEGMQNAALFTAVGAYFGANRAAALGSMNFAYGVGSFIGPTLAAYILVWSDQWRAPLIVFGILGLVTMIAGWLVVPSVATEWRDEARRIGPAQEDHVPSSVWNKNVLICALSAMTVGISGYGFLGLYPTYLRTALDFTVPQAGFAASLFGFGALLGIPAGYLADRLSQRVIGIAALVTIMLDAYFMFNVVTSSLGQNCLAFIFGAAVSGVLFVNTYSLIQRSVREAFVGKASGIVVSFVYIPASLAGYLFATLRNSFGWGHAALLQLCLFPIVAIAGLLFLDERAIRRPRTAKHQGPGEKQ